MRLVVVRMPCWWARMTAALILGERPKSSAFTIKRRGASRRAIVRRNRSGKHAIPGAENQEELLSFVEPRGMRAENIEASALQLAQQPPIDGAHQFRRG